MMTLLAHAFGDLWPWCAIAAWFVGMGLHEGGHAYAADRLGDRLPRLTGKLTFNPFRHIEWNNPGYVISAVVLPVATAFVFAIPIGMAWVYTQRGSTLHDAKVAIAGPIGSFAAAAMGIVLLTAAWPLQDMNVPLLWDILLHLSLALVLVSMAYGVYNLIPFPPLDGGTVAYHFLNDAGKSFFDQIRPYGFLILVAVFMVLPSVTGGAVDPGSFVWAAVDKLLGVALSVPKFVWGT